MHPINPIVVGPSNYARINYQNLDERTTLRSWKDMKKKTHQSELWEQQSGEIVFSHPLQTTAT